MQETMRIRIEEKWPFFNLYHEREYIQSHNTKKIVALKEKGESREYYLYNLSELEIVVYKIDGGIINSDKVVKCDYGIYTEQNILYLIELKGSDYLHALEQILSTIDVLLKKPNISVKQLNARIVLSKNRIPNLLVTKEKKLSRLLKQEYGNGSLLKQTRKLEEKI